MPLRTRMPRCHFAASDLFATSTPLVASTPRFAFDPPLTAPTPAPVPASSSPLRLPQLPDLHDAHDAAPQPSNTGPFSFLRRATLSLSSFRARLPGGSNAGSSANDSPSLLPPQRATGGLLAAPAAPVVPGTPSPTSTSANTKQSWRDWKKLSLDVYLRLAERPREARVRVKQTIALLPLIKLKPTVDLGWRADGGPVAFGMHLDVKLLDCMRCRVNADGAAALQVRARAPLADPRFVLDVIYERQLATGVEGVKISLRALDVAFLKAPRLGGGVKFPLRFGGAVKGTLRIKKFVHFNSVPQREERWATDGRKSRRVLGIPPTTAWPADHRQAGGSAMGRWPRIAIAGPTGLDIKLRCLEYR